MLRKSIVYLSTICIAVLFLPSCTGGNRTATPVEPGDTLNLRYARNLQIVSYPGYTVATLRNPWDTTKTLHKYYLTTQEKHLPQNPDGTIVHIPLRRSVVFTSVHCGLVAELGASNAIVGVCNRTYINLDFIQNGCDNGTIADLGGSLEPDVEKLIMLSADAVLLSPFENSGGYGRLDNLAIPLIECADYMETSALGRAEWVRFYGILYGCQGIADSIFQAVEHNYNHWAQKVAPYSRPTVLAELKNGATWYVPGGNSTMGRLYADAGANYTFRHLPNSGSIPLSFETVFNQAADADIWLIKYYAPGPMTYPQLQREFAPYAGFKAFREKHIFGCNTLLTPFYEETPFHPERLIQDLARIFHPEIYTPDSLRYFFPL